MQRVDKLGQTVDTLSQMREEELKSLISKKFDGLKTDEIDRASEEIRSDISKQIVALKDSKKDLRIFESGKADPSERQEIRGQIKFLKTLDKQIKVLAQEESRDQKIHNHDIPAGQDINVSPLELDGETTTYNMGGTGPKPDEAPEADALDPRKFQKVFMNTKGQKWDLVAASEQDGEYTFKIAQGETYAYVKFTNAKELRFIFNDAILPSKDSLLGWPILDQTFQNNEPNSLSKKYGMEV